MEWTRNAEKIRKKWFVVLYKKIIDLFCISPRLPPRLSASAVAFSFLHLFFPQRPQHPNIHHIPIPPLLIQPLRRLQNLRHLCKRLIPHDRPKPLHADLPQPNMLMPIHPAAQFLFRIIQMQHRFTREIPIVFSTSFRNASYLLPAKSHTPAANRCAVSRQTPSVFSGSFTFSIISARCSSLHPRQVPAPPVISRQGKSLPHPPRWI